MANKKMISRALVKEVHTEARNLKKTATAGELAELDFECLNVQSRSECIYGQMTGSCFSPRAESLIRDCALRFIVNPAELGGVTCTLETSNTLHFCPEGNYLTFSPIETYIANEGADNAQLIAFLKGERKTLNLYPTVNC